MTDAGSVSVPTPQTRKNPGDPPAEKAKLPTCGLHRQSGQGIVRLTEA